MPSGPGARDRRLPGAAVQNGHLWLVNESGTIAVMRAVTTERRCNAAPTPVCGNVAMPKMEVS
jgi:hypothetical protein